MSPAPGVRLGSPRVRKATPGDAAAIADVLRASFLEYRPLYTPEAFDATTLSSEEIERRLQEGHSWIAVQDDLAVGTVSVVLRGRDLYVRSMAVMPAARGRAIGALLLREVESFAARHRCRSLILSTTPFLERAIRLYERWGFRRNDAGPHELHGTPLFTMIKPLVGAGEEIALRPAGDGDVDFVVGAERLEHARRYVLPWTRDQHLAALSDPDLATFIVERVPDRTSVGFVFFAGIAGPHRSIELRRLVVTEPGRGYGRAALQAAVDLAFARWDANRVWLDFKEHNDRARRLYESAGFVREGILRECLRSGEGYESLVVMSMLRREYLAMSLL